MAEENEVHRIIRYAIINEYVELPPAENGSVSEPYDELASRILKSLHDAGFQVKRTWWEWRRGSRT